MLVGVGTMSPIPCLKDLSLSRHELLGLIGLVAVFSYTGWILNKRRLSHAGNRRRQCGNVPVVLQNRTYSTHLSSTIDFVYVCVALTLCVCCTDPMQRLRNMHVSQLPYASLRFFNVLLTPKFHMTRPLLNSSWEVSCGAHLYPHQSQTVDTLRCSCSD